MKHSVILILGSNQGDRLELLRKAREAIIHEIGNISLLSSVYESEPSGYKSPNMYLNQAMEVQTALSPHEVLAATQQIETRLGRTRSTTQRYTDRTIDIDILFIDSLIINTPTLNVPHPRISQREFVLRPLIEIIPEYKHPQTGEKTKEMFEKLKINLEHSRN